MNNSEKNSYQDIIAEQKKHFKRLHEENDKGPNAVASKAFEIKKLRYQKITEMLPDSREFSVYEVGYGLGHFYEHMKGEFEMDKVSYRGSEIVEEYYQHCTEVYDRSECFELRNILKDPPSKQFDYVVMSGVFHQIGDTSRKSWQDYMRDIIRESYKLSTEGVVFNFLSQKVDYRKEGNYYASITDIIDFVTQDLSRFFEIRHNYPLFEATVLVYHPEYVAQEHPEETFQKYF